MNANSQVMEHRWGSRVRLDAAAMLRTADGRTLEANVRNASLSGAFVETSERPLLLSRVAIRPCSKNSEWLEACVVRFDATGMGLEWVDPGLRPLSAFLSSLKAQ